MKVLPIILGFILSSILTAKSNTIQVKFYSETIQIEYDNQLFQPYKNNLRKEDDYVAAFKNLKSRPYQTFLNSLQTAKSTYHLNDWLYTKLIKDAIHEIRKSESNKFKSLLLWLLLSESGFDARATYTPSRLYVNVATKENVFESPMYDHDGKTFANISVILRKERFVKVVYDIAFIPNKTGKNYSITLHEFPNLKSNPKSFFYQFEYKGEQKKITAELDQTIISIMKDYPKFDEIKFVEVPLSQLAKTSLLSQLDELTKEMTNTEKMEFFVSFTRTGLEYGSDRKGFGTKNRPLIAEEALFYPYVDCEDKVAVMYNLVKELTHLKAVVIAMPGHLSFAVDLNDPKGESYRFKGRKFTICDPTGPESMSDIGVFPYKDRLKKGHVLGELR